MKREKLICIGCGKKYPNSKKNHSLYCGKCRGFSLRFAAQSLMRGDKKI